MRRLIVVAIVVLCTYMSHASEGLKFASALSRQGTRIIQQSHDGTTTRQCSCDEQKSCLTEIKQQTYACFDQCWLTNHSEQLKSCFSAKEKSARRLSWVLRSEYQQLFPFSIICVRNENGPQIPNADIRQLIANTERRINAKAKDILRTLDLQGRELLEKALEVAACIKECVLEKNKGPDGFCFNRKGCLPKVDSYDTEFTLKKCMRSTKWKKEASELCSCSVKAGVNGAQGYCDMLSPYQSSTPKSRT
ncbi:hypothetical protein M3Y98_00421800 [Aphelenchoides besseyi]|nr:hypothetical protein M3Y98_00421800 [Aphelenchoides besseyi]